MGKLQFEFPDEDDGEPIEIEPSSMRELGEPTDAEGDAVPDEEVEQVEQVDDKLDAEMEIEIVDDTPPEDRNRPEAPIPEELTDEELKSHGKKIRARIEGFAKRYHDERREKEVAQRERVELENFARVQMAENAKLKGTVGKNQHAILEQAKGAVKLQLEKAEREYLVAHEEGDAEKMLAAQNALTDVKVKADKINSIKLPSLQEQVDEVQSTHRPAPQTQERAQAAPQVDPQATTWAEENEWFGADEEMTGFALVVHNKLVKGGVSPQSDEYYEQINSRMRQVFPENFEKTGEEPAKRSSQVVAPATRSTAPKTVKLTKSQVAIAKTLGVPLEEYARSVAEEMRKDNG
jgi:hypothetical protein